ncbi:hypothetical protein [Streptomyces sp. NBC_00872]|uniref:hypothetical protein n=1 Tax=Streptomyces sp. NBC_00872 TaxID=2903686 RepID=UPI003866B8CB|nr:hypothetical protein OG214_03320 [Streptomyces sp. NBC_00872]
MQQLPWAASTSVINNAGYGMFGESTSMIFVTRMPIRAAMRVVDSFSSLRRMISAAVLSGLRW